MPNEGQGGGIGGTLKAKLGPLPTWAWLAIVTVVLLGYWLYTQHKAAASGTGTQAPTPASVGQPGVVVINQDEPGTEPQEPAEPGGGKKPPREPHHHPERTRQIVVNRDETLGQLAARRHWTADTLRDVEELNVSQGGGEWTAGTRLEKGQTVLRPIKHP